MGYTRAEMESKIDDILAFADIGDFVHQPVKMYSSGMFARLAFAVAINVDPDVLIVDEALSVGDAAFQLKCFAKMQKLRSNGTTILFVSHDTYSVRTLCTNALWINKGCLMDAGNPVGVINNFLYDLNGIDPSEPQETIKPAQIENITHKDIKLHFTNSQQITLQTEEKLRIEFSVENTGLIDYEIVYVFNLYRQTDNLYVCGSTTLMDSNEADIILAGETKNIILNFDTIPLLVGTYRLRLAVNDSLGMGILCDIKEAVFLNIQDNHQAEGLIHLQRQWSIQKGTK
jgi:ABC-type Fe3+/spermidine/putrescine transport system ATPase subunit